MSNDRSRGGLYYIFGFLLLLLYILPYALLGANSYIEVHDLLDGTFVYRVLVAKYSGFYQNNIIIQDILNGVPLSYLGSSELNVVTFMFKLFPPLTAYVVNDLTVRFIAFAGTFALLTRHLRFGNVLHFNRLSFFVAIVFALVPYYTIYGICSAGIPMLLYAFLNLLKREKVVVSYLLIVLFCLYSSLVLVGVFVVPCLGLIWLIDFFKRGKANMLFFGGLIVMMVCYMFFEHLLLEEFTAKDRVVLHRSTWKIRSFSTRTLIDTVKLYLENQYHAGDYNIWPIIAALALLFVVVLRKKERLSKYFYYSILGVAGLAFLILVARVMQPLLAKQISLFISFQIDRFYFLLPAAWTILFAVVLFELANRKVNRFVLYSLVLLQGVVILHGSRIYKLNLQALTGKESPVPTYKQFFATPAFSKIDRYINKDKSTYRIASIGIHPSVALFNGFRTIDAYTNLIPLQYQAEFRKIIEKELSKNEKVRKYFDEWGNRCYIFPAELDKRLLIFTKTSDKRILNMELNSTQLKKLGCEYIVSSVPIDNPEKSGLRYLNVFTDASLDYNFYLFAVI